MGMGDEELNPRPLEQELVEFRKMEEAIHDIDYYKAQVQAAQNGQDAAHKLVEAWRNHYVVAKRDTYKAEKSLEDTLATIPIWITGVFAFGIIIGIVIGGLW